MTRLPDDADAPWWPGPMPRPAPFSD